LPTQIIPWKGSEKDQSWKKRRELDFETKRPVKSRGAKSLTKGRRRAPRGKKALHELGSSEEKEKETKKRKEVRPSQKKPERGKG